MNPLHDGMLKDKKVLIVDNERYGSALTDFYLRHIGINKENISFVGDGLRAIEMVKKILFDIVIMDIRSLGLNGIEAAQIIKNSHNGSSPKLLAYTTETSFDNKKGMKELFDGSMLKPVTKEKFAELIHSVLDIQDRCLVQKN